MPIYAKTRILCHHLPGVAPTTSHKPQTTCHTQGGTCAREECCGARSRECTPLLIFQTCPHAHALLHAVEPAQARGRAAGAGPSTRAPPGGLPLRGGGRRRSSASALPPCTCAPAATELSSNRPAQSSLQGSRPCPLGEPATTSTCRCCKWAHDESSMEAACAPCRSGAWDEGARLGS